MFNKILGGVVGGREEITPWKCDIYDYRTCKGFSTYSVITGNFIDPKCTHVSR